MAPLPPIDGHLLINNFMRNNRQAPIPARSVNSGRVLSARSVSSLRYAKTPKPSPSLQRFLDLVKNYKVDQSSKEEREARQLEQLSSTNLLLTPIPNRLGMNAVHQRVTEILSIASEAQSLQLPIRSRVPTLTPDQTQQLLQFVQSSPHARRMPFSLIPTALRLECSEETITATLAEQGYKSYPAIVRPHIDETTRMLRLNFAESHVQWTAEQWKSVIFTAETQVYIKPIQEVLVTRKSDEGLDVDCVNHLDHDIEQSSILFFAHFSGLTGKGPLFDWNRMLLDTYGRLRPESYYQAFSPSFANWLDEQPCDAPFAQQPEREMSKHCGVAYRDEVRGRLMTVVHLPPASPDLNPINEIFNTIQTAVEADRVNLISNRETEETHIAAVARHTWDGITDDYLEQLIGSMTKRCQAIIDANGMYTRF
ncbi:transposable element TCB2 transposase [Fusarium heterosporum]|uniref:Transposable element TCB2 transposase n=1 Tax=Fusarium heterosporum TaxID=42747 RepID=A0A8H5TR50_FUSHE|nr:transposable element TCB2 transposase [Fusarium heterosporum]